MPMGRVTVTLPPEVVTDIDRMTKNRSGFILEAVRREIARRRRKRLRESLRNPHPESGRVEEGFEEWAASLPEEDLSGLVDPRTTRPVRWIPGRGWKETG